MRRSTSNAGSVTVDANASLGITGLADAKVVATVSSPRSVGSSSASVTAVHVDAKLVADVLGDTDHRQPRTRRHRHLAVRDAGRGEPERVVDRP